MKITTTALQQLRRRLPKFPAEPKIDEFGEEWLPGFKGDISSTPLYITDGHICLLASAVDPTVVIGRDKDNYAHKYTTEARIGEVWKLAEERIDVAADLIGVTDYCDSAEIAFLRDRLGRVMVVNAHLLSFGLRAADPDALSVSVEPLVETTRWESSGVRCFDTSLALKRAGKLVGLIMPMRLSADHFEQFDLRREPINLADAAEKEESRCPMTS